MNYPLALRRAALMRQQRFIQEQLEQLEALPELEAYPDGTIIRAKVRSDGRELTYVFLKLVIDEVTFWWNTGACIVSADRRTRYRPAVTTEELTKWLTDTGRVILEWTLMLPAGMEPDTVIFESHNRVEPGSYVLKRAPERGDGRYVMGQPS